MKLAIIGCGNMGWAYAKSAAAHPNISKQDLLLFEKYPPRAAEIEKEDIGIVKTDLDSTLSDADMVILAVKPQMFADLGISEFVKPSQIMVSIMAGVTIDIISKVTSATKIVRAMPNTPCQLGKGVTGFYANDALSPEEKKEVSDLLALTGTSLEVQNEAEIDAVTSVSGSGPAYFYLFLKSMTEAGVQGGLSYEVASMLAQETMNGAYNLLKAQPENSYDDMMAAVRSKGGTTAAALDSFIESGLDKITHKALGAARNRAKELSDMIEI